MLDRVGDDVRRVVADGDPPKQRVADLDLVGAQPLEKLPPCAAAVCRQLSKLELRKLFWYTLSQYSGLASSALVWPEPSVVCPTIGTSQPISERVLMMRDRKPAFTLHGMITCGAGIAHAQQLRLQVGVAGIDVALIDDRRTFRLQHRHIGFHRSGAVAGGVADQPRPCSASAHR